MTAPVPAQSRPKSDFNRESILEVSAQVFRSRGYRATSLEAVSDVFGVRRPAIYYYFKSKADILVEIHDRLLAELTDELDAVETMDIPASERFARVIRGQVRLFAANINELAVFIENETELPTAAYRRARNEKRAYTERLEALYARGVAEGAFADLPPRLVVFAVAGMTNWMYRWYDPAGRKSVDEIADHILRLAQTGWLRR